MPDARLVTPYPVHTTKLYASFPPLFLLLCSFFFFLSSLLFLFCCNANLVFACRCTYRADWNMSICPHKYGQLCIFFETELESFFFTFYIHTNSLTNQDIRNTAPQNTNYGGSTKNSGVKPPSLYILLLLFHTSLYISIPVLFIAFILSLIVS